MLFGEDQFYTVPGPDGKSVVVKGFTQVVDGDELFISLVEVDDDGDYALNEEDEIELSFVEIKISPVTDPKKIAHLMTLVQAQLDEEEEEDDED